MWTPYKDEDIYAYYLGEYPVEGRKYFSPFREDGALPSLAFKMYYGHLLWTDFGGIDMSPYVRVRNAVGFVIQKEGFKTEGAAENFILNDLLPEILKIGLKKPKQIFGRQTIKPIVKIRKAFTSKEWQIWKHIKPELILKHKIYPCSTFTIGKKELGSTYDSPAYLYVFGKDSWKFYKPSDPKNKWKSHNIYEVIEGYDQLPSSGNKLIITSSKKDSLTTETYLECPCINPTNEGSWTNILAKARELNSRFSVIEIWLDADKTGHMNTDKVTAKTTWRGLYSPLWFKDRGLKDQTDMVRNGSPLFFQEFYKNLKT